MKFLHLANPELPFFLIANKSPSPREGEETLNRLSNVLKKFLSFEPIKLGIIPEDRSIQQAVSRQIPFLELNPKSSASKALTDLAERYKQNKLQDTQQVTSLPFVSKLKKFLFER
jgi:flagellar biosynthesis protein FlhG